MSGEAPSSQQLELGQADCRNIVYELQCLASCSSRECDQDHTPAMATLHAFGDLDSKSVTHVCTEPKVSFWMPCLTTCKEPLLSLTIVVEP